MPATEPAQPTRRRGRAPSRALPSSSMRPNARRRARHTSADHDRGGHGDAARHRRAEPVAARAGRTGQVAAPGRGQRGPSRRRCTSDDRAEAVRPQQTAERQRPAAARRGRGSRRRTLRRPGRASPRAGALRRPVAGRLHAEAVGGVGEPVEVQAAGQQGERAEGERRARAGRRRRASRPSGATQHATSRRAPTAAAAPSSRPTSGASSMAPRATPRSTRRGGGTRTAVSVPSARRSESGISSSRSETPASSKVAISRRVAPAAASTGRATSAPVPSPSRRPKSTIGSRRAARAPRAARARSSGARPATSPASGRRCGARPARRRGDHAVEQHRRTPGRGTDEEARHGGDVGPADRRRAAPIGSPLSGRPRRIASRTAAVLRIQVSSSMPVPRPTTSRRRDAGEQARRARPPAWCCRCPCRPVRAGRRRRRPPRRRSRTPSGERALGLLAGERVLAVDRSGATGARGRA